MSSLYHNRDICYLYIKENDKMITWLSLWVPGFYTINYCFPLLPLHIPLFANVTVCRPHPWKEGLRFTSSSRVESDSIILLITFVRKTSPKSSILLIIHVYIFNVFLCIQDRLWIFLLHFGFNPILYYLLCLNFFFGFGHSNFPQVGLCVFWQISIL